MKLFNKYKQVVVGMRITIKDRPKYWSSLLNISCPLHQVTFPYTCIIKEIGVSDNHDNHVSMTDGKYGWSLDCLIDDNLIEITKKEERKFKLKKLNETIK